MTNAAVQPPTGKESPFTLVYILSKAVHLVHSKRKKKNELIELLLWLW